ncbi:MAG: hypothetical protein PWQ97_721 [Tepidanaerobacteraceae bacterium]|nr:hypothetical protein [Tepidanaerobacteraceae bacterium]
MWKRFNQIEQRIDKIEHEHGERQKIYKVVQEMLCNAKLSTAADIYSHVTQEVKEREAMEK